MRKRIPMLVMLLFVLWSEGWLSQPKMPRILDADDPEHYQQLVSASIIPKLFQGCLLLDSGVPSYTETNPDRIFFRQTYILPFYFSNFEVSYRMDVMIIIVGDTIVDTSKLRETWENYKQQISKFEKNPAVIKFLQVVKPSVMKYDGAKFFSEGNTLSRAGFNIESGDWYFLLFKHDELIQHIGLYLPALDSLAWFSEFYSKLGIGRLYFGNGKLEISQSQMCPVCSSNVLYHYSKARLMKINLSTDQSWEHFAAVRYALQVVENQIAGDTLRPCYTGTGYKKVFIRLTRHFYDDYWQANVAIKCRESPKLKTVSVRFLADRAID